MTYPSRFFFLFLSSAAALAQEPTAAPLPAVFIVGDSTANNSSGKGWGDPFGVYFDAARIKVVNRARGGRSARTFFDEGLWDKLAADLKPGDFVLIQFGHNDGGAIDRPPARGDLPGIGEETAAGIHTFGWYLRRFVNDAKAHGARPILLSLTVRNIWRDGHVERGSGKFAQWSQDVAEAEKVPFVDLTNIIADEYEARGEPAVNPLFPVDHTHTSAEGADLYARLVVAGLKGIRSPLIGFVSKKGEAVSAAPSLASLHLPAPANPDLPTLFLIGDSTVRNGHGDGGNGQWGWGEPIFDHFDPAKINVVNRAVGGTSSRTFYRGAYWRRVLNMMKPGDFVMMQFGHNDGGALDGPQGYRVTLPGWGDEVQGDVHAYGWYLKQFMAETRAKGATPIVCSLVPRKTWKDGAIVRSSNGYGRWAAEVAKAEHAPFIDLNEIVAKQYDALGPEKVDPLFADPHTHTSRSGAELNAASVVLGLQGLEQNPLAGYLKGH